MKSYLFFAVSVLLFLTACTPPAEPVAEAVVLATSTPSATATPAGRTFTDATGQTITITDDSKIVAVGGAVTEIVYALGAGDRVSATDVSSTYPPAVKELPQVGYVRTLAAEPILALAPTLILTNDEAGPAEALQQLQESGTPVIIFQSAQTVDESVALIRAVAEVLGLQTKGEELITQLQADLKMAEELLAKVEEKPRVMFIYARGVDTVNAAGLETSVHTMIEMAGAVNAIHEYEGFKPLTAEAAVSSAPDVYLLFTSGLESVGGEEGLLQVPGLAETPAGQNKRIYHMDGLYLTAFGPRTGQALLELIDLLHPELE